MVEETRWSFMEEVNHMIKVSRQLKQEGELSESELKTINKHLGALKATLKQSTIVAPCTIQKPRTRVATY